MRKAIVALLVAILSMTSVIAAAADYCSHEVPPSAQKHLGHHQHSAEAKSASGQGAPKSPASACDVDCVTCHVFAITLLPSTGSAAPTIDQVLNSHPIGNEVSVVPARPEHRDKSSLA